MSNLNRCANALADGLLAAANSHAKFAEGLSDLKWNRLVLGIGLNKLCINTTIGQDPFS